MEVKNFVPYSTKMTKKGSQPRGRPRSIDRERTIQLMMDTYWQLGVGALSLNEVCRRAQISKPALYREFGGEDGLMAATLESYREQFVLPLLTALTADQPFGTTLDGAINTLTSDRGTPAGCLFTKMRLARSRLGPLTEKCVQALEEEQRSAYENWYKRALERGEANPDLSPEFAARYLDTQFATILVQMSVGVSPEFVREQARLALGTLLSA